MNEASLVPDCFPEPPTPTSKAFPIGVPKIRDIYQVQYHYNLLKEIIKIIPRHITPLIVHVMFVLELVHCTLLSFTSTLYAFCSPLFLPLGPTPSQSSFCNFLNLFATTANINEKIREARLRWCRTCGGNDTGRCTNENIEVSVHLKLGTPTLRWRDNMKYMKEKVEIEEAEDRRT